MSESARHPALSLALTRFWHFRGSFRDQRGLIESRESGDGFALYGHEVTTPSVQYPHALHFSNI